MPLTPTEQAELAELEQLEQASMQPAPSGLSPAEQAELAELEQLEAQHGMAEPAAPELEQPGTLARIGEEIPGVRTAMDAYDLFTHETPGAAIAARSERSGDLLRDLFLSVAGGGAAVKAAPVVARVGGRLIRELAPAAGGAALGEVVADDPTGGAIVGLLSRRGGRGLLGALRGR